MIKDKIKWMTGEGKIICLMFNNTCPKVGSS